MPELAKSYKFKADQVPTIDDVEVPWWLAHPDSGLTPLVAPHPTLDMDSVHILWLPILIDGPIPAYGTPEGEPVEVKP